MKSLQLTLLQISDTHGYLEPHPELFWQGDKAEYRTAGGYARLLTIFQQVRRERTGAETHPAAFVTTQGVPEPYGRNRRDLELHAIDALKRYCAAQPWVNADLRGPVIAV